MSDFSKQCELYSPGGRIASPVYDSDDDTPHHS